MPKISVIIPVYNVEPYLARCLDSVCNQTLKDIEIICINDCSPDNSLAILKDYASKDNRIKIIDFAENKNAAVARNAGLEVAKGEYLGFVDPDDYIDLNFYEELYNKALTDNADIAKCECIIYELDGKIRKSDLNNHIKIKNKYCFTYEWWSAIYKNNLIKENNIHFPEECPKAQDIVFLNRCILKANTLALVDDVYYHYIRREDSLDAQSLSIDKIESGLLAHKIIFENLKNCNLECSSEEYIQIYVHYIHNSFSLAFKNNTIEAKKLYADFLINSFSICKNKENLCKNFKYSYLLNDILQEKKEDIAEEFFAANSEQKIFLRQLHANAKRS